MKRRLASLRFRILIPFIIIILFVITLLNTLFSRAYLQIILQQEQEVNAVGFETVIRSVTPLVDKSIQEARSILSDDRVASYARMQFASSADLIRARIRCRDFLQAEIASRDGIYGLFFMRKDGSMFGSLSQGNFFLDDPKDNPLPESVTAKILDVPPGQTVWAGPISVASFCGFDNSAAPKSMMIAAWKTVHVSYGECSAMLMMDESILENLFASLRDGKNDWYLLTEDHAVICHTGPDIHIDPDRLIRESSRGRIFRDEEGEPSFAFSVTLNSPEWTLVRKVSMEKYEQLSGGIVHSIAIFGGAVLLVMAAVYELWLRKFLRQFRSLQEVIVRIGQGDLESTAFEPTSISEFRQMQGEIDRTDGNDPSDGA